MKILCHVLALSALLLTAAAGSAAAKQAPVLHLASGSVRGYLDGSTAVFKGIPYAAPPVGNLRWREPQPVAAWPGVRDATKFGSACTQSTSGLDHFLAPLAAAYGAPYETEAVSSSEDCLYLNVWVPEWASRGALPVMVWLHGGSNVVGSGSQSAYDGSALAAHGVIVVTINYRLGVMGFFSHPDLTAESPHHSSGNYGLLDQIAALQWVKDNIAQFGGNPANVTVFGESAGAVDIGTLMASPLSKGLFQRAISESGPAFGVAPARTLAQGEAVGKLVGSAAQGQSSSPLAALRQMPAAQVIQLTGQVLQAHFPGMDTGSAVVDGWVLPRIPAKTYAAGSAQHVDLMIGINGREFSAFRVGAEADAKKNRHQQGGVSEALKSMADTAHPLYGAWTDLAMGTYLAQSLVEGNAATDQAANDMLAACPIGATSTLMSAEGQKVFVYRFDRAIQGKGESNLGAFHGLEIPYVFGSFQDRNWKWLKFDEADYNLSQKMQVYWTNFAKTGNPNSSGLPKWPTWESGKEGYLDFSPAAEAFPRDSFAPRFCYLSLARLKQGLDE